MPHGIAIGLNGFPYFAIAGANKIGRIDPESRDHADVASSFAQRCPAHGRHG